MAELASTRSTFIGWCCVICSPPPGTSTTAVANGDGQRSSTSTRRRTVPIGHPPSPSSVIWATRMPNRWLGCRRTHSATCMMRSYTSETLRMI
uniref:Putative secreted protein n=1 Tax=Anopheles darlingi TaxID=43151 RepID=A0A2M4DEC1_ANODA